MGDSLVRGANWNGKRVDSHWYPQGLAVEERQDVDVECAPRVVSRGAGGKTGWSDGICGNESG